MDYLPSVDELQDHLAAHDRAIRQIIVLDGYIERLSQQTFIATMGDQMAPAFQKMIRVGVAEGVKRMFKEYRLMKWLRVQEMAATVRQILTQEIVAQVNDGNDSRSEQYQSTDYPLHQSSQLQPENQSWQLAAPEAYNWEPVTDNWTATPTSGPTQLQFVSPISTPAQATPHSARLTSVHQAGIIESPFGRRTLTNRQLFPDTVSDVHNCDSDDWVSDEDHEVDSASVNIVNQSSSAHHDHQMLHHAFGNREATHEQAPGQDRFIHISEPVRTGQEHYQQSVNAGFQAVQTVEGVEEADQMDWEEDDYEEDEFDDSYDEDDANLAGVLFAAHSLLPDEQTTRLDVEMGDMGVGHILFDRVSATWYTAECEFYRAN